MTITRELEPIPLTGIEPVRGWEEFLRDGEGFLRTATAAYTKKNRIFTSEILYNLIAMAIEKFIMAALMRHGAMPYNHTMQDLVAAMEDTFPGKMTKLGEGLLELDKYQDICDLDGFKIIPPESEKIPGMLALADQMHTLVTEELIC
ncbi:MAG: hypothetical protein D3913_14740 [Candidatus Electrothrix sp. LOE1_4_5]|nr:hypothetical protein [Candidatus Electrothrix gigas]MCI5179250.1 hypothetical protein [Candidatus Electrothrix gigas]MCI5191870.1 hypothetical protein [Candidatus Electrothrix gigas]MCI5226349.1 hypothetical protein [Candidatus Electrothrix gigas]